jgi:hypothetical protein
MPTFGGAGVPFGTADFGVRTIPEKEVVFDAYSIIIPFTDIPDRTACSDWVTCRRNRAGENSRI